MAEKGQIRQVSIKEFPLWEKSKQKRTLLSVALELTARCNNNCTHCYINLSEHDQEARRQELSTDALKSIIDEAISLGALWFLVSGGEPLLRKDFTQIYTYLKKRGALVSVFTNAALISDKHIRLFKKYPPRDIEVTVYGVTQETHFRVTRKKHFKDTMEGIERIRSANLPMTLKAVAIRSNAHEFEQIAKYCRKNTDRPFRFDPFINLRMDKNKKKNQTILSERLNPDEIVKLESSDHTRTEAIKKKCASANGSLSQKESRLFNCLAGINNCCISYDGKFKLCSFLTAPGTVYDLQHGNLKEAWTVFAPKVLDLTSDAPSFKRGCACCEKMDVCMWCPAHADLETGHLDRKVQYFCDTAEKRYFYFNK